FHGLAELRSHMNKDIAAEFQRRFPAVSVELGPDNLARLLNACTVVDLPARRKVFRDRMPVDSLYLVLEGEMLASVEDGSRTLELGHVKPGDWLGEVAVLSGEMLASSTVSTLTRCRALKMHARDFEDLVIHDPDISHVLLGQLVDLLAERLRESNASAARLA
ncbi:MAG: cyclic nucleotide-binding domain-containing protein, partial [Rhodocyclales bacterium]|nr:cyclic nucleotide-binding domain-containing protein [Rhodocyclales bacterium]